MATEKKICHEPNPKCPPERQGLKKGDADNGSRKKL